MEIKRQLGKLALRMPLPEIIAQQRAANGIGLLDLQFPHVLQLGSLPTPHKDPFDRILVAQALVEGATLVTVDPAIEAYPVPVLW
jgi:PIN domain nuclease of toxin-antitoxin system